MKEALEKIQLIFKESKNFALFSKKNCEDYKLLAKEALKVALLKKNLSALSLHGNSGFEKKWNPMLSAKNFPVFPQQTSIRIPKNQYKIKELSYEENEDFLSLVVTAESGNLNKETILFEPVLPKVDAAFCFFDSPGDAILKEFENYVIMPPKEKIVFLTSGGKTYAERISQIIKTIFPDLFSLPQIATLLFSSLITETNNFVRPVSQEVLRFGSELLSLDADKELVKTILNEEKTISSANLLGRALARTHADDKLDASWTFLSREDLKKTNNLNSPPSFFYNIIRNLRDLIPFRTLSLLFWQNEPASPNQGGLIPTGANLIGQNIIAMAAADEEKDLIPLAQQLGARLQSRYFTAGPFNNFSEAELRFRKALEEMVSLKI